MILNHQGFFFFFSFNIFQSPYYPSPLGTILFFSPFTAPSDVHYTVYWNVTLSHKRMLTSISCQLTNQRAIQRIHKCVKRLLFVTLYCNFQKKMPIVSAYRKIYSKVFQGIQSHGYVTNAPRYSIGLYTMLLAQGFRQWVQQILYVWSGIKVTVKTRTNISVAATTNHDHGQGKHSISPTVLS